MVHTIIRHKVKDFDRWLPHFREHDGVRRKYGCTSAEVRRDVEDPEQVVIEMDWNAKEGFQEFMERSDVRSVMERAGVVSEPEITIVSDPVPWQR